MLTKNEFEPMQIHTKGGGGQKFNITNSTNPADYVLIVILSMIDINFENDLIKIE